MSSPNMNLPIPTVSTTFGPEWAELINACLTIIDQHTHASGSGVPITPDGMNIASDLEFQGNNASGLRSAMLNNQLAVLAEATDLRNIYSVNGDLYYNNGSGTPIQLTIGSSIAGASGSITGLTSPASVVYSSITDTFTFQSDTSIAGNLDGGSLFLRNLSPNSTYALELKPPAALANNYSVTLPALPVARKIVTMTSSGEIEANFATDGVTVGVTSNNIYVLNGGITSTQLATSAVTTIKLADAAVNSAKIEDGSVTPIKLSAGVVAESSNINATSNSVAQSFVTGSTTSTVNITSGRAVIITLKPGSAASTAGYFTISSADLTDTMRGYVQLRRNGSAIANFPLHSVGLTPGTRSIVVPCSSINYIDTAASGSTYYDLTYNVDSATTNISITNCQLSAAQI